MKAEKKLGKNSAVHSIPPEILIEIYRKILKIRLFEEKIVEFYRSEQQMQCPVHLYIGQEAIAAAVSACLSKEDYAFSTHRSHGHYIAKGGDINKLAAELYGKKTGCSKGKGGSMHVVDLDAGFIGSSAIVSGSIPIALGAALAFKMQKKNNIVVSYFGDGAADEGVIHEALNFASLKKLPIVFICENNFYATNSPNNIRKPLDNIAQRASVYAIKWKKIDGNDAIAVYLAAKEAVESAKSGQPFFIEATTYRWKAHVGPEEDPDCIRPKKELLDWLKKCPVDNYEKLLLQEKVLTKEKSDSISQEIKKQVDAAFVYAKNSEYPKKEELFEDLFT